jgi:hypothetical protein
VLRVRRVAVREAEEVEVAARHAAHLAALQVQLLEPVVDGQAGGDGRRAQEHTQDHDDRASTARRQELLQSAGSLDHILPGRIGHEPVSGGKDERLLPAGGPLRLSLW